MMPTTELLYVVEENPGGWFVLCEDQHYGPYHTCDYAVMEAMAEAAAAVQAGFSSLVLLSLEKGLFEIQRTRCGQAYSALPCGRA